MHIPFVDLTRQSTRINKHILNNVGQIIDKGTFILGKEVSQFEREFAKYIGKKYCIGVASGTDAILLSLRALGIGKGDEVIAPAFTFIASISPIIFLGAKPVLVDILPDQPLIDYTKIEKAITKKTKAILPVHLYGYPCDMDKINKIAKQNNLFTVEDACQAHGSSYIGKKAGALGDISAFSFYPAKNLGSLGDGGAVVTSDKSLFEQIRMLRDHGQRKKYIHELIGYNSRLDTIDATALKIKLAYLDRWNEKRRGIAKFYNELLKDLPIEIPFESKAAVPNYHLYVIRTSKRDQLYHYLRNKNIFCGIHYPIPLHLQPGLSNLGYKINDFPNSERLAKVCLSLPMFAQLKKEELMFISNQIHSFFKLFTQSKNEN